MAIVLGLNRVFFSMREWLSVGRYFLNLNVISVVDIAVSLNYCNIKEIYIAVYSRHCTLNWKGNRCVDEWKPTFIRSSYVKLFFVAFMSRCWFLSTKLVMREISANVRIDYFIINRHKLLSHTYADITVNSKPWYGNRQSV